MAAAPRWTRHRAADALVGGGLLAVGLIEVWVPVRIGGIGDAAPAPQAVQSVMVLFFTVPLAWRRSHPLASGLAVCSALAVQVLVVVPELSLLAGLLPLAIVDYSGAVYAPRARRGWALAAVLVVEVVLIARIPEERDSGEILFAIFLIFGVWMIGDLVRSRQKQVDEATEEVRRAEAGRVEWAARALADERTRIARELHDIIAHGVSIMGVQAATARVLVDDDPEVAKQTLRAVEAQSREAVGELQRLLGILRESDGAPELEPQPGLDDAPALVEQMRDAGMEVELAVVGTPRPLPAGVDLAVYRVIQEAMTNTLKHSGGARARVCVAHQPDAIAVTVKDEGTSRTTPVEPGHGLIGMRERIVLYGGSLELGPGPTGGFVVAARIPVPPVGA